MTSGLNQYNHKAPCKGCQEREVGCHATCERYQQWHEELNRKNQEMAKEHEQDAMFASVRAKKKGRVLRKKSRGNASGRH